MGNQRGELFFPPPLRGRAREGGMRGACRFGKSPNGNAFWQSFAATAEHPAYPPPGAFAPTSPSRAGQSHLKTNSEHRQPQKMNGFSPPPLRGRPREGGMRGACSFGKSLNRGHIRRSFTAIGESSAYPPPGAFAPTSPSRGEVVTCMYHLNERQGGSYAIAVPSRREVTCAQFVLTHGDVGQMRLPWGAGGPASRKKRKLKREGFC